MTAWADSHIHLHDPRLGDPRPVISAMRQAGIRRCVANATGEDDWPAVAELARAEPDLVAPAFGIHPWLAHEARGRWSDRLAAMLEDAPTASIGECGLDGWVSGPPMAVQEPVFLVHLRLAWELDRPVTIHCLKAWEPLFAAFKKVPPPERFLMHSFGGSAEIAERLLKLGAWFSFSGYFLQPKKAAVREVFQKVVPRDRLLLETDAPDMRPPAERILHPLPDGRNHPGNLPAIGAGLAEVLGIETEGLAALTLANHRRFFGP